MDAPSDDNDIGDNMKNENEDELSNNVENEGLDNRRKDKKHKKEKKHKKDKKRKNDLEYFTKEDLNNPDNLRNLNLEDMDKELKELQEQVGDNN